jgi:hypothetical protein
VIFLKRYILCGIFTGMGLLSMLLLFLTLDSIQLTQKRKILNLLSFYKMKDCSVETMKQLLNKSLEVLLSLKEWKHIDQFFLIPMTIWSTIESAFLTVQFTRVRTYFHSKSNLFVSHQGLITCLVGIR